MLAPNELVATGPSTPRAAVVSRVVVVFPLVPDTRAICRPAARCASRSGSMINPSRPPITDPSPRPVARDSAAAPLDTVVASLARIGLRVVTRTRLADRRSAEYRLHRTGPPWQARRRARAAGQPTAPGLLVRPVGQPRRRRHGADRGRRARAAVLRHRGARCGAGRHLARARPDAAGRGRDRGPVLPYRGHGGRPPPGPRAPPRAPLPLRP